LDHAAASIDDFLIAVIPAENVIRTFEKHRDAASFQNGRGAVIRMNENRPGFGIGMQTGEGPPGASQIGGDHGRNVLHAERMSIRDLAFRRVAIGIRTARADMGGGSCPWVRIVKGIVGNSRIG
jgi:hypothetical protein